eukprot:CFRG3663T1
MHPESVQRRESSCQEVTNSSEAELCSHGYLIFLPSNTSGESPVRQSLCFSATLPASLQNVLSTALRSNHSFIDCTTRSFLSKVSNSRQVGDDFSTTGH